MNINLEMACRHALSFLVDEIGFVLQRDGAYLINFDAPGGFIEVTYDPRSHELGMEFGRKSDEQNGVQRTFSHPLVLRYLQDPEAQRLNCIQVGDQESAESFLKKLGDKIRSCVPLIFKGDADFFSDLASQRSVESASYRKETDLRSVRSRADRAWERGDYKGFLEIMDRIGEEQNASERRKIFMAKKRLQG